MSSSNEVRVAYIEESVYGETPGAGNFKSARFTSESLSATPETVESAQIRVDRLSSGQVLAGLTLGGDLSVEFAKASDVDDFFEGAMFDTWSSSAPVSVDLSIDTVAKTIDRAAGDFNLDTRVGQIINLTGFSNSVNNDSIMVMEIVDADTIRYIGPDTLVSEVGVGTSFQVADELEIGTTRKSYSIEKKFNDLTTKGLNYTGAYVDGFTLNATYGEIVNGSFSFAMANYSVADQASELITDGRTVDSAPTSVSLNGSVDLAFLASSDGTQFEGVSFCVQSLEITLANNLQAQNCIGKIGPDNYSLGTAQVNVSLSAYLSDDSWNLLNKKLTQEAFSLGFILKNQDGYYGFYLPQIQVSFDDPASAGQNTDIIINASGVAKVGANQEKSLYIYKSS
jgi:hypothetical protein